MSTLPFPSHFHFAGRSVSRMGYGAMQLAGPHVFGPPRDRAACLSVLRTAIDAGVAHIDTSDFYGPHVTNQIIREALHPYPANLTLVTKIGARRDDKGEWLAAASPQQLRNAVQDNLLNLGLDMLDVVNLRIFGHGLTQDSIGHLVEVMVQLQQEGLIRHIGLSNVTVAQIEEAQQIADIVCVQNMYNLVHREDDALIDMLAAQGIAYTPFFPLGGFTPIQSSALSDIAARLQATSIQVALAWLLHRSPNILLIPGTASVAHLRENLQASQLSITPEILAELDAIGGKKGSLG